MNVSAKHKTRIPWRRVIPIVVIGLVAGYNYGRPTIERMFNISLPALNGNNGHSHNGGNGGNYQASLPKDFKISTKGSGSFKLKEVGKDRYETPAGLLYTMGSRGEHRIEHVMRHAFDADRPAHGVFLGDGDQDAVLKIIDEAYELVKSDSPRAKLLPPRNSNDGYKIDMQRKVGYEGGQKGKRSNGKSLDKVQLILKNGNQVITAYPVR